MTTQERLLYIIERLSKEPCSTNYKGYTIIYRVNLAKDSIDILRIFNKNKPPLS